MTILMVFLNICDLYDNILLCVFSAYKTTLFMLMTVHIYRNERTYRIFCKEYAFKLGRAVAQAVIRWLPTAAARVRVRAACGFCGGQSGTGAGFLRVLRFPLQIIPPISPS
jgi:hypothetical protein